MANVNPFRFSTKYQDDETGLLYYGLRYYAPNTACGLQGIPERRRKVRVSTRLFRIAQFPSWTIVAIKLMQAI